MKIYNINEEKGFNKIFDKEKISNEQRKEIFSQFKNLLNINVVLENKNGAIYQTIKDVKGNTLKMDSFNPYQRALINDCFNDFIGITILDNELIEIM